MFWVDASSLESINMSLGGISSIPTTQASCLDGSAESALQWISGIQEEWSIVFDNADDLPPGMVAKFIPPGNRGNILITSQNRSMGRLIAFENVIEINKMKEADAISLFLKASCLNVSAEHKLLKILWLHLAICLLLLIRLELISKLGNVILIIIWRNSLHTVILLC